MWREPGGKREGRLLWELIPEEAAHELNASVGGQRKLPDATGWCPAAACADGDSVEGAACPSPIQPLTRSRGTDRCQRTVFLPPACAQRQMLRCLVVPSTAHAYKLPLLKLLSSRPGWSATG